MIKKLQIGVIGSAGAEEYPAGFGITSNNLAKAQKVGYLLAKEGATIVTGGKSGIMEYAARGAKEADGTTVGVISGKRGDSNDYTDIEILSGMAMAGLDELILVLMCDAFVVIGGGAGTLEEMAIAYRNNKPIVVLENTGGWSDKIGGKFLDDRSRVRCESAKLPSEAVKLAVKLAKK